MGSRFGFITQQKNINILSRLVIYFSLLNKGDDIPREFETAMNFQFRYRSHSALSPALEIYQAQDTKGIGPMLIGDHRLGLGKKVHWEFGNYFWLI